MISLCAGWAHKHGLSHTEPTVYQWRENYNRTYKCHDCYRKEVQEMMHLWGVLLPTCRLYSFTHSVIHLSDESTYYVACSLLSTVGIEMNQIQQWLPSYKVNSLTVGDALRKRGGIWHGSWWMSRSSPDRKEELQIQDYKRKFCPKTKQGMIIF